MASREKLSPIEVRLLDSHDHCEETWLQSSQWGQVLCSSCPVPLSIVSFHLLPNFLMDLVFPFRNGFIVRK